MDPIETIDEIPVYDEIEGSCAWIGDVSFPVIFDDEQAESLMMEGTSPQITCSAHRLRENGVELGTTIDRIDTYDGRQKGPYRAVRWQVQDDGAFVVVGLQQL